MKSFHSPVSLQRSMTSPITCHPDVHTNVVNVVLIKENIIQLYGNVSAKLTVISPATQMFIRLMYCVYFLCLFFCV